MADKETPSISEVAIGLAILVPGGLAVFASIIAVLILGSMMDALVIMKYWNWFVAPNLGIAPIGLAVPYGLRVIYGTFTYRLQPPLADEQKKKMEKAATRDMFMKPAACALAIGCGWVIHHFFM